MVLYDIYLVIISYMIRSRLEREHRMKWKGASLGQADEEDDLLAWVQKYRQNSSKPKKKAKDVAAERKAKEFEEMDKAYSTG